jgi:hypothetical protein
MLSANKRKLFQTFTRNSSGTKQSADDLPSSDPSYGLPLRNASQPASSQSATSRSGHVSKSNPMSFLGPSLVDNQIFTIFYKGNKDAFRQLIDIKCPIPIEELMKSANFIKFIEASEPSPSLDHKGIHKNLSAMREYLLQTAHGRNLLAFYKQLLALHGQYITAATEMYAFIIFAKTAYTLFITKSDPRLIDHVVDLVPEARTGSLTMTPQEKHFFEIFLATDSKRTKAAYTTALANLIQIKRSKDFPGMQAQFTASFKLHQNAEKNARTQKMRDSINREARRRNVYLRNRLTRERQMGMQGLTSHTDEVEQSVIEFVHEHKMMYMNFDGTEGVDVDCESAIDFFGV